ncbi:hypothetical protein [Lysobacter humi (ex Lee et al. 2017)]
MTLRSEPLALVAMLLLLGAMALKRLSPDVPPGLRWAAVAVALALTVYSLLLWRREQAEDPATRAVSRRYLRESLPAMLAYVGVLMLSVWLLKRVDAVGLRAVVALLPALPIAIALRATARYIRDLDELQRRIELEALALGSVATGFGYMTGGFLQGAKVIEISAAGAMFWMFPLLCIGYGIARCVVARRYR